MRSFSIFNHVLGPVMRGPSSSHTAGSFHIARTVRSLLGAAPARVTCAFDPAGSFARTYAQQGSDRAFAMGFLGRELADPAFPGALALAPGAGLELRFEVRPLAGADHPNAVRIRAEAADGSGLDCLARSTGGGDFDLVELDGWPVRLDGASHALVAAVDADGVPDLLARLRGLGTLQAEPEVARRGPAALVTARCLADPGPGALAGFPGLRWQRRAEPVYFVHRGAPAFRSGAEITRAGARGAALGRLALDYEAGLLGWPRERVQEEALRRWDVMADSIRRGLDPAFQGLELLQPCAGRILQAAERGALALGGPTLRAGARALAVMHVNGAMGVVCAAPTGGSAGVLPGVLATLAEERGLDRPALARAFLAAGAVGVVVAERATFAAEVAGCQVEIGVAGAMAAAAVVEAAGGSADQACQAAAVALQNAMGTVCDPVAGRVEIPCHTRNAAAAAGAFLCADLVLGGYANPVPLDETVDAVLAVGRMLPSELRCTALGGLAQAPSALALGAGACAACPGRGAPAGPVPHL